MFRLLLFQFTPLREGLLSDILALIRICPISIHAPARGASFDAIPSAFPSKYFNSRPCERGFEDFLKNRFFHGLFQFTPLREGLQLLCLLWTSRYLFQFTPLREGLQMLLPVP